MLADDSGHNFVLVGTVSRKRYRQGLIFSRLFSPRPDLQTTFVSAHLISCHLFMVCDAGDRGLCDTSERGQREQFTLAQQSLNVLK